MDAGVRATITLTDGTSHTVRTTFGDLARAERHCEAGLMNRLRSGEPTVGDIANMAYAALVRIGAFAGSFDDFLNVFQDFTPDADEDNTNGNGQGTVATLDPTQPVP